MRLLLILAPLIALAACAAITEPRVKSALRDAGLSERMAGCMAKRMVDRLTITQLRRLQSLGQARERIGRDTTLDQFLFQVRALRDPEILSVTSRAGLRCALSG